MVGGRIWKSSERVIVPGILQLTVALSIRGIAYTERFIGNSGDVSLVVMAPTRTVTTASVVVTGILFY